MTDAAGTAQAIDASIAGDALRLVINGRTLNLRRLPPGFRPNVTER